MEKYSPHTSSSEDWAAKLEQKEASELAARRAARYGRPQLGISLEKRNSFLKFLPGAKRALRHGAWVLIQTKIYRGQAAPIASAESNGALLRLGSATTATAQPSILGGTFNGS